MTAESNSANAYLRTRVLTATPEELRLMLLDGAIKFARQGRDGLARKDYEASYNGLSQSRDIILELLTTIRPEHDPDLCERVKSVYTFMYTEMVTASMERDAVRVDSVIRLLEFERETWSLLMAQIQADRNAPPAPAPPSAAISVEA